MDAPPPYSLPKEFVSLPAMAELLAAEQKKLNGPGVHDDWRSLRDRSQKPLREAWHAYMFGTCYAHFHEIPYGGMFMKPEAEEYSFRDATRADRCYTAATTFPTSRKLAPVANSALNRRSRETSDSAASNLAILDWLEPIRRASSVCE